MTWQTRDFKCRYQSDDANLKPLMAHSANGSETILLVEDEEMIRKVATMALESRGYRILAAENGQEAIGIAKSVSTGLQLVVTDVMMPAMNGRELVDHLRGELPWLKYLFVSGYTEDTVLRRGVHEESEAFLQKPFTPVGLAMKVREMLDV